MDTNSEVRDLTVEELDAVSGGMEPVIEIEIGEVCVHTLFLSKLIYDLTGWCV